jgi:hypothetical protein
MKASDKTATGLRGRGLAMSGVSPAGNRFAAWAHGDPLGEFVTPGQDKNAVLAAHHARRRTRAGHRPQGRGSALRVRLAACPCGAGPPQRIAPNG